VLQRRRVEDHIRDAIALGRGHLLGVLALERQGPARLECIPLPAVMARVEEKLKDVIKDIPIAPPAKPP